jgi:hypothetical protein
MGCFVVVELALAIASSFGLQVTVAPVGFFVSSKSVVGMVAGCRLVLVVVVC